MDMDLTCTQPGARKVDVRPPIFLVLFQVATIIGHIKAFLTLHFLATTLSFDLP